MKTVTTHLADLTIEKPIDAYSDGMTQNITGVKNTDYGIDYVNSTSATTGVVETMDLSLETNTITTETVSTDGATTGINGITDKKGATETQTITSPSTSSTVSTSDNVTVGGTGNTTTSTVNTTVTTGSSSDETFSAGSMQSSSFSMSGTSGNSQMGSKSSSTISSDSSGTINNLDFGNMKVTLSATDNSGNIMQYEVDANEYAKDLKKNGLTNLDIVRIINGEISLEELLSEIENDSNRDRMRLLLEASYLNQFTSLGEIEVTNGSSLTNLEELKTESNEILLELQGLLQEKEKSSSVSEIEAIVRIINRLKMGESLENILETEIIAWEYVDENGINNYVFSDPYLDGNYNGEIQYKVLHFEDIYNNSDLLNELKSVLDKQEYNNFLGEYTVTTWTDTDEQIELFYKIEEIYGKELMEVKSTQKVLDEKILELQEKYSMYESIYEYINSEIDYYLKFVEPYILKENFESNSSFNLEVIDTLEEIGKKQQELYIASRGNSSIIYLNDNNVTDFIICLVNGEGNMENGSLKVEDRMFGISSTMYGHYVEWLPYINDTEKQIINYIYNTEGKEAAFKYLQEFSDVLDKRWLDAKIRKDQEFASKNWFNAIVASLGSIVVTPFEGINAAVCSLRAVALNEKIRRTDVYSSGDIWRQQVSLDIANHSKFWSFMYNTGMSMADTGLLIGANVITGGSASLVLSATLMGSRAYVSTLNDALDRGLSDGTAVTLAFASAATESLMENYSVGHLMNLENAFGGAASKIINKMALSTNNSLFMTKTAYAALGAVFQGICEGEEEFATEILNYVIDNLLSEDKSNRELTINNYVKMGYSLEEATQKADVDFANQVFQAFSGGFISGLFFGGHQSLKTSRYVSNQMALEMINSYNMSDTQKYAAGIELARLQKLAIEEQQKKEQKQKKVRLLDYARLMFNNVALNEQQMKQFNADFKLSNKKTLQMSTLNTITLDNSIKKLKSYVNDKISKKIKLIKTTLSNASQKITLKLDRNLYSKYQKFVSENNIEPYYFIFEEKYESLLYDTLYEKYNTEVIQKLMTYDMDSVKKILDFALKSNVGKSYLELYDDYSFFIDQNTVDLFELESEFILQKDITKILNNNELLNLLISKNNLSRHTFFKLVSRLSVDVIKKIPNDKIVNDILDFYTLKVLNDNILLTDNIVSEYCFNSNFRNLIERAIKIKNFQNVEQYISISIEKKVSENITSKFLYLLSRNDDLLQTIDFRLLEEKFDSIPIEYIEKFSLYRDIQNLLINLDDKRLSIISRIINTINSESTDITRIIYKSLINIENSEFLPLVNSIDVENLNDEQVKNLILLLQKDNNLYGVVDAKELNNLNFNNLRIEYFNVIDSQISDKTVSLTDLKNAIFEKKFGISYTDARFIYDRYYVKDFTQSNLPTNFINTIEYIKNIIETYNKANLREYYYKINQSVINTSYDTFFNLESSIREEYAKMYKETLYQLNEAHKSTNPKLQNIIYNGTKINFYELHGDFKLLIHSLGAYNNKYEVPTNFKTDWLRPQISYHGISTTYISNDQIAPARAQHPILGFSSFSNKQFLLAGNYDLVSTNVIENYDVSSMKAYRILPPELMINLTRHNHNEIVLERMDNESYKLMPSYVIYLVDSMDNQDNFSDSNQLYQETLQAATDFGVPILVVDRLAYAKQEMNVCMELFDNYKKTKDITKIEELFIRLINNNVGCRNFDKNRILPYQEIFSNDRVKQVYDELIEFIKNNSDVGASLEALEKLESLLKNEELKYINVDAKPPFDFKVALNEIEILKQNIELNKKSNENVDNIKTNVSNINLEGPSISIDDSNFDSLFETQKESSSDYFGKQTYSFGVNQNAIEELMIFAKDKEKHPRAAKVLEKLVNVIRKSNPEISMQDIYQILENANNKNGGICSYGAFTTAIVDYARNNNKFRQALEEKLNLTLFDNNGNINWLGATELMARIYIHAMVTNESIIVKDGKYDITAQSKSVFTNNRVTEFFKSIGFEANGLLLTQFVITNVNDFRDTIQYNLDKGNILVLNVSPINKDSEIQFNITELNGEKWSGSIDTSHVAYITAIDENGIETASWSYRAYITFEELQKCNFSLTRLNFDDIQVEQVKTIMQEAEIKNMTESNLQSSQSKTNTLNELENTTLNSPLIDIEDGIKAYSGYTEYDSNFDEKLENGITLTRQGIVNGQNNILARINTNYIINKVNSYINGFINKKESSLPKSLQNNKLALTQLINNELFTSLPRKNQFSILKQFSTSVLNNIDVLKLFPELTVHNSELINLNKDNLDLALAILRSYNILGLQKIQLIADFNENVVENTMLQELLITQIQGIVEYGEIPNNLKNSKNFAQLLLQSNEVDSRKKSMLFRTFNKELQKQLVTEGDMAAINYADSDILFSRIDNKSAIEIALENNPILLEMILSSTDFSDFFKGYIKSHLSDEILSNPKIIQLLIDRPTILKLLNTVPYILQNNFNLAKSMLNSEQLSYFDKTSLFSKFSEDIQIQLIMEGNIFAVSHADVDLLKMEMEDSKTLLENSLENNPNLLEQIWNSSDIYPIAKKNFILEFGYEPSIKHKVASIITQSPQYLFVFNALPLFLRNDYNLALSVLSSEKINLSDKKKIFSNFSKNIQKQLILEGNIEAISYASQEILEQKIGDKTLLETVLEQNSDLLQKIMISEQFSKLIFPKLNENLQEQLILEGNVHAVSLASIDLLKKKTDGKTLLQIAIEQNPDLKNINIPAMVIDEEIFKIYSQYGKIAINKQQVSQIYSDYISIMNNDNSSNQSLVLLLGNSLLNSIMNGNLQSLFILKNLVELKKNNLDLHIKLDTETNECFWQGAIQEISIGTLHSKWQDTGTIKHELGHLLFDMILNNELPNNWESIVNNARIWSSNKVGNVFLNRIQKLFKEINSNAYDSAYKNFEQQVKTWGFMSVNEYRSALIRKYETSNYELDNIIKYMKLAGYKSDTIAAISKGKYTVGELADISIKSLIDIEKERILRMSYGDYLALSDIIDAVFKGTGKDLNNYSLYFVGKHGEKYYNTGLDNLPFHEIIANFTQLKISNNNELLEWISLIFGDEFYNCLNNTYNKFIAINSNDSSPRNHINVNSSNVEIITLETHKNSSETSIDFDSASIILNSPNVTIYQKREYFSKIPEQIKIDLINAGNLTAILLSSDELLLTKDETQDKCLWEIALINSNKFLDTFIEHTEIGDLNENSYQKIKYSGKSLILNVPRLRNGGHLRSGLMRLRKISEYVKSELKKNGFDYHKLQLDYEYHEVYKYPNGVSVGYYPFHEQKIKRSGINQTYFPETWTNLDIFRAALTILTNENIDNYEDGQTIFGYYKGVKVGIILTNRRIATIFPNNFNQPDDDSIIELETKISHLKQKNVYEQINESEKDIIYIYKNIGGTREILETRKITLKERK